MTIEEKSKTKQKVGWAQIFLSVCSAFFGVQSDKNRQADFSSGSFWPYLIIGFVVVAIFIISLLFAVKLILYLAL